MVKRRRDANKIIVIGIPEGTNNEALEAMFTDVGKVYSAYVVGLDESTGKSRGYGFVTMASEEACTAAITKMHKTVIEGRTINVRMVEERSEDGAPADGQEGEDKSGSKSAAVSTKGQGGTGKDANKVLVAGLSAGMTDERLQLICEEFGLVIKATVVRHATTGKSRGFGFVTFTNRACQQACITVLDKRELGGGRVLNVRAVETRVPEPVGGGPTPGSGAVSGAGTGGGQNPLNGKAAKDGGGGEDNAVRAKERKEKAGPPQTAAEKIDNVCRKYQVNKCHRGKSCRWRHEKIPNFSRLLAEAEAAEKVAKDPLAKDKEAKGGKDLWHRASKI